MPNAGTVDENSGYSFSFRGFDTIHKGIKGAHGRTLTFTDGSQLDDVDAIIWATGYEHHFPFMDKPLRLVAEEEYTPQLYKGVLWKQNYRLSYIGMEVATFTFASFWAQAAFAVAMAAGLAIEPPAGSSDAEQADLAVEEASLEAFKGALAKHFPGKFRLEFVESILDHGSSPCWGDKAADDDADAFASEQDCVAAFRERRRNATAALVYAVTDEDPCVMHEHAPENAEIDSDYYFEVGHLAAQKVEFVSLMEAAKVSDDRLAVLITAWERNAELIIKVLTRSAPCMVGCRVQEDPRNPHCGDDSYLTESARFRDASSYNGFLPVSRWKHHTSYADSRDDTIGCYFDASKCADRELARKYPTKHMHEAAKSKPVMSNGGLTRLNRLKSGRDVTGGRGNRADRKKPGRSRRT